MITCTGSYTVQQSDIDNNGIDANGEADGDGDIDNTATGDSDQTDPVDSSQQVPVVQNPLYTIVKTVTDVDGDGTGLGSVDAAGDVYTVDAPTSFPPPAGSFLLVRFRASQVATALATGTPLTPAESAVVEGGLDGGILLETNQCPRENFSNL